MEKKLIDLIDATLKNAERLKANAMHTAWAQAWIAHGMLNALAIVTCERMRAARPDIPSHLINAYQDETFLALSDRANQALEGWQEETLRQAARKAKR